jgi:hypothetical protein
MRIKDLVVETMEGETELGVQGFVRSQRNVVERRGASFMDRGYHEGESQHSYRPDFRYFRNAEL